MPKSNIGINGGTSTPVPENSPDSGEIPRDDLRRDVEAQSEARSEYLRRVAERSRPVFSVTSAEIEHERTSRLGVTVESMIDDEVREMTGFRPDNEEDRIIWQVDGGVPRAVALVRPGLDGVPLVARLDGEGVPA